MHGEYQTEDGFLNLDAKSVGVPHYQDVNETCERYWIERLVEGDHTFLALLLARHSSIAMRIARRNVACAADAEEVLQEAAWKVFTRVKQFRSESSFRTWYLAIVLNEARVYRRSRWRYVFSDTLTEYSLPSHNETFEQILRQQQSTSVCKAVESLPPRYRVVLRLHLEEKSVAEIACQLRAKTSSIKTRLSRARVLLAKRINRGPDGSQRRVPKG